MTHDIPFTEYVLPNGRKRALTFQTESREVFDASRKIIDAGLRFEVERLRNGSVSATITGQNADVAFALIHDDKDVQSRVERMIMDGADNLKALLQHDEEAG